MTDTCMIDKIKTNNPVEQQQKNINKRCAKG